MKTIDSVWMAISVDPKDNTEGVCGVRSGGVWIPLLAADDERLPFVIEQAYLIAKEKRCKVKIIRLTTRQDVKEIDGTKGLGG